MQALEKRFLKISATWKPSLRSLRPLREIDGTCLPASGAAPLGLPSAVFRARSHELGSSFCISLPHRPQPSGLQARPLLRSRYGRFQVSGFRFQVSGFRFQVSSPSPILHFSLTPLPPGSRGALSGLFASLAVYRARSHELGSSFFISPPPSSFFWPQYFRNPDEKFPQSHDGDAFRQGIGISAGCDEISPRGQECPGTLNKTGAELG